MNPQVHVVVSIITLMIRNAIGQFQLEPLNKDNIEGVRGNTLTLKWKFTGLTKTLKVYEANLYFNVTTAITKALICKWNSTSGTPLVTSVGRKMFSTRALVVYKSGTYNFTITKLQYNDTGKYFLQVNVGPKRTFITAFRKSIMKISKIKAEMFCHGFLPKNLSQNENEEATFSFSLCGDPEPQVKWFFDTSDNNEVIPVDRKNFDYKYMINLPALPINMCGKNLYIAAKRSCEEVETVLRVYVNFTPPVIKDIKYVRGQSGCNLVEWTSIDAGNCHVTYTIQYENETGIIEIISGIDDDIQSWCSKPYPNATSIRMWAMYSGKMGTISPAIQLMDSAHNFVKSQGISLKLAVGIGAGFVGFLLLLLSTLFVIRSKKVASQKNATRDETNSSNEQDLPSQPQHAEIIDAKAEEGDGNNNSRIIRKNCQKKIIKERNESPQELHQDAKDNRPIQTTLPARVAPLEQMSLPEASSGLSASNDINNSAVELNDYTALNAEGTDWAGNEYEQLNKNQPGASSRSPSFLNHQTDYENQRSNGINKSAVEPNDYTALTFEGTDWTRNEYKQLKKLTMV